jgi:hypothetical protein
VYGCELEEPRESPKRLRISYSRAGKGIDRRESTTRSVGDYEDDSYAICESSPVRLNINCYWCSSERRRAYENSRASNEDGTIGEQGEFLKVYAILDDFSYDFVVNLQLVVENKDVHGGFSNLISALTGQNDSEGPDVDVIFKHIPLFHEEIMKDVENLLKLGGAEMFN